MKITRLLPALLVAAAALTAACEALTGPGSDVLRVHSRTGALVLANRSDAVLYYTIYERETAARVLWGACDRPGQCPSVPANGTVAVPYDDIGGWEPGDREAIVYHWMLRPRGGGRFAVDSIRSLVVTLP